MERGDIKEYIRHNLTIELYSYNWAGENDNK